MTETRQENGANRTPPGQLPATGTASFPSTTLAISLVSLLCAYLLLTSTVDPGMYGLKGVRPFDAKRLIELAAFPIVLAIVLLNGSLRSAFGTQLRRIPPWLQLAFLALFSLGVLSAFVNAGSRAAFSYSLADVALLAFPTAAVFCVAACRDVASSAFDHIAGATLILIALAVGLQELVGVLAVRSSGLEFNFYVSLPYFHFPRFYNQLQSWMMPATVAVVLMFPGRRLAGLLVGSALALHWYVVLETGARGTILGVVLATGFCALAFPRERWSMLRYQGAGLLAGLALFLGLVALASGPGAPETKVHTEVIETPNDHTHGSSLAGALTGPRMLTSTGRIGLWRDAIGYAKERPVLGIGPGNYACGGWPTRAAHPHSFPLQILAEWGVPAFLVLLTIAIYIGGSALKILRDTSLESARAGIARMLFAGVLAAAISACVDGVFLMPASQVTGMLIGGWLLANVATPRRQVSAGATWATNLVLTLACVSALLFANYGWREYETREPLYKATWAWNLEIPRFWRNGKVCEQHPKPEQHPD